MLRDLWFAFCFLQPFWSIWRLGGQAIGLTSGHTLQGALPVFPLIKHWFINTLAMWGGMRYAPVDDLWSRNASDLLILCFPHCFYTYFCDHIFIFSASVFWCMIPINVIILLTCTIGAFPFFHFFAAYWAPVETLPSLRVSFGVTYLQLIDVILLHGWLPRIHRLVLPGLPFWIARSSALRAH